MDFLLLVCCFLAILEPSRIEGVRLECWWPSRERKWSIWTPKETCQDQAQQKTGENYIWCHARANDWSSTVKQEKKPFPIHGWSYVARRTPRNESSGWHGMAWWVLWSPKGLGAVERGFSLSEGAAWMASDMNTWHTDTWPGDITSKKLCQQILESVVPVIVKFIVSSTGWQRCWRGQGLLRFTLREPFDGLRYRLTLSSTLRAPVNGVQT